MMHNIVTCTSQDCTRQSTFSPATHHYQYRLFVAGYLNDHMAGFSAAFYSKSWGLVNLQDIEITTLQLSFLVIHKVGNVDNFVFPKFANK